MGRAKFSMTYPSACRLGKPNKAMFDGFRDLLNPQDVAVCESVQRGLRSPGYRPGPLMVDTPRSWRSEQSIYHFGHKVLAALEE